MQKQDQPPTVSRQEENREAWLLQAVGEGVVVALGARREQPRDAPADTAAHLVDCVLPEAP